MSRSHAPTTRNETTFRTVQVITMKWRLPGCSSRTRNIQRTLCDIYYGGHVSKIHSRASWGCLFSHTRIVRMFLFSFYRQKRKHGILLITKTSKALQYHFKHVETQCQQTTRKRRERGLAERSASRSENNTIGEASSLIVFYGDRGGGFILSLRRDWCLFHLVWNIGAAFFRFGWNAAAEWIAKKIVSFFGNSTPCAAKDGSVENVCSVSTPSWKLQEAVNHTMCDPLSAKATYADIYGWPMGKWCFTTKCQRYELAVCKYSR